MASSSHRWQALRPAPHKGKLGPQSGFPFFSPQQAVNFQELVLQSRCPFSSSFCLFRTRAVLIISLSYILIPIHVAGQLHNLAPSLALLARIVTIHLFHPNQIYSCNI